MSEEKNQSQETNGITERVIRLLSLVEGISILVSELAEKMFNQYRDHRDPECVEAVEAFMRTNFVRMYEETDLNEKRLNEETLTEFKKEILALIEQMIKKKSKEREAFNAARLEERDKINNNPKSREELEAIYVQVWDTDQLANDFVVKGFLAPYVSAIRISDKAEVVLAFQHHPRFYFTPERKDETQQSTERAPSPGVRDPEERSTH